MRRSRRRWLVKCPNRKALWRPRRMASAAREKIKNEFCIVQEWSEYRLSWGFNWIMTDPHILAMQATSRAGEFQIRSGFYMKHSRLNSLCEIHLIWSARIHPKFLRGQAIQCPRLKQPDTYRKNIDQCGRQHTIARSSWPLLLLAIKLATR